MANSPEEERRAALALALALARGYAALAAAEREHLMRLLTSFLTRVQWSEAEASSRPPAAPPAEGPS